MPDHSDPDHADPDRADADRADEEQVAELFDRAQRDASRGVLGALVPPGAGAAVRVARRRRQRRAACGAVAAVLVIGGGSAAAASALGGGSHQVDLPDASSPTVSSPATPLPAPSSTLSRATPSPSHSDTSTGPDAGGHALSADDLLSLAEARTATTDLAPALDAQHDTTTSRTDCGVTYTRDRAWTNTGADAEHEVDADEALSLLPSVAAARSAFDAQVAAVTRAGTCFGSPPGAARTGTTRDGGRYVVTNIVNGAEGCYAFAQVGRVVVRVAVQGLGAQVPTADAHDLVVAAVHRLSAQGA